MINEGVLQEFDYNSQYEEEQIIRRELYSGISECKYTDFILQSQKGVFI